VYGVLEDKRSTLPAMEVIHGYFIRIIRCLGKSSKYSAPLVGYGFGVEFGVGTDSIRIPAVLMILNTLRSQCLSVFGENFY
jgi:hypothetical protein